MSVSEAANSKSFLRSFFVILMFGLLSNIKFKLNSIVLIRVMPVKKLHKS